MKFPSRNFWYNRTRMPNSTRHLYAYRLEFYLFLLPSSILNNFRMIKDFQGLNKQVDRTLRECAPHCQTASPPHSVSSTAPLVTVEVSSGQRRHSLAPKLGWKWPSGHDSQISNPFREWLPGLHCPANACKSHIRRNIQTQREHQNNINSAFIFIYMTCMNIKHYLWIICTYFILLVVPNEQHCHPRVRLVRGSYIFVLSECTRNHLSCCRCFSKAELWLRECILPLHSATLRECR